MPARLNGRVNIILFRRGNLTWISVVFVRLVVQIDNIKMIFQINCVASVLVNCADPSFLIHKTRPVVSTNVKKRTDYSPGLLPYCYIHFPVEFSLKNYGATTTASFYFYAYLHISLQEFFVFQSIFFFFF